MGDQNTEMVSIMRDDHCVGQARRKKALIEDTADDDPESDTEGGPSDIYRPLDQIFRS